MDKGKEESRREMIVNFAADHQDWNKNQIATYFSEMGIGRSTVYHILSLYEERGNIERKSGSGRPAEKVTDRQRQQLCNTAKSSSTSQNQYL